MTLQGTPSVLKLGAAVEEGFGFDASRMMPSWLGSMGISLAFSTYEIGKLFLVGLGSNRLLK